MKPIEVKALIRVDPETGEIYISDEKGIFEFKQNNKAIAHKIVDAVYPNYFDDQAKEQRLATKKKVEKVGNVTVTEEVDNDDD
jgi:hypothetical protein